MECTEAELLVERVGGNSTGSINLKTDLLIAGDKAGSKLKPGDIIPEVVRVLSELRPAGANAVQLPDHCRLQLRTGTGSWRSRHALHQQFLSSPAQLKGAIRQWVCRAAMDVDGYVITLLISAKNLLTWLRFGSVLRVIYLNSIYIL